MRHLSLCIVLTAILLSSPAAAQWSPSPFARSAAAPDFATPVRLAPAAALPLSDTRLLVGGVAGGVLGVAVGAAVYGMEVRAGCDYTCGLGALLAGLPSEAFLLPLGVHLANGRRGSPGAGMAASLGILAGGLLTVSMIGGSGYEAAATGVLIAIPVAQLYAAVALERRAETRRAARAAGRRASP